MTRWRVLAGAASATVAMVAGMAYTARFGASQTRASAVAAWLRGQGFTGVTIDP